MKCVQKRPSKLRAATQHLDFSVCLVKWRVGVVLSGLQCDFLRVSVVVLEDDYAKNTMIENGDMTSWGVPHQGAEHRTEEGEKKGI